jgi:hypothetical protein
MTDPRRIENAVRLQRESSAATTLTAPEKTPFWTLKRIIIATCATFTLLFIASIVTNIAVAWFMRAAMQTIQPEADHLTKSFDKLLCLLYRFGCLTYENPLGAVIFPPDICAELGAECASL